MQSTVHLEDKPALSVRYDCFKQDLSERKPEPACFDSFTYDSLFDPDQWLRAYVLWEYAVENQWNETKTVSFFRQIFSDYDAYFEFDLNEEDYDWYWNHLVSVLDGYGNKHPEGWNQLASQYLVARSGRKDNGKVIHYLDKAASAGYERTFIKYGYFLYCGSILPQDKERAEEMFSKVKTKEALIELSVTRAFTELWDGDLQVAKDILAKLEEEQDVDEDNRERICYLHAYLADIDGRYDEALAYYMKRLTSSPHPYVYYRLAYLYANKLVENPKDTKEILALLERSYRLDPVTRTMEGLYSYYYESGSEWQDNDKAIYFLEKGVLYEIGYCAYQLALIYLNNENYKDIEKGLAYLDEAIRQKYYNAYLTKSIYYRDGTHLERDVAKCIQLLEEVIALGSTYAWYHLGFVYERGFAAEDGKPDYQKALEYYLKAAEANEIEACEQVGIYYRNGYTGEKDPVKARIYYEQAISLGSDYARVELGVMCMNGEGEESAPEKAFALFTEAAEHNYSPGHYFLGLAYKNGWSVAEDPDKAVEHLRIASEAGHAWAHSEYALCFERAYGVEKDEAKALEYMLMAAEKNVPFAQYKVGCYYFYGREKIPVNYEEAVRWLTRATENNYQYAFLELGNYYFYRYNQTNEPEKSYELYEKAARSGYVNEGLGLCLQMGTGVEKNETEGFKYLLKGAEDGYIRAMYYTGRCYYFEIGTQENKEEAFRWFNEAAGYHHIPSLYYKGRMLVDGEGTLPDITEGVECVRKAAEGGNRDAMYELGNYYLVGKGVEPDEDASWDWFEKAASKGHKQAMKVTGKSQRK